jgi:hypothetical protein
MKKCSKCKVERPLDMFNKKSKHKDGLAYQCKICTREAAAKYRKENSEKIKESNAKYRAENSQRIKAYQKKYRAENPEKGRANTAKYRNNNKEKIQKEKTEYKKKRRQTDPAYKMRGNVSKSIWTALKARNKNKTGSVWEALPYTSKQLCEHLEKQFDEHMSWDNYGTYWHVDHIYPQSLLPYDNYEDPNFQKCWALENLQPLEATANILKSNKI